MALLVLQVFLLEIGRVLTEVVTLQVLAALDLLITLLLVSELLLQGHFLGFKALNFLSLLVLLFLRGLGLTAVDGQFIISLLGLDLAFKDLTFTCEPILVCSETLQLSLGRLRLIQNHLDPLKSVLLIGELPSKMVVQMLAVLSGLIAQVVEHLLRAQVLPSNLLGVHEALTHREQRMLVHLNHLGQFTLFFVETGVLLLLLTQL